MNSKKLLFLLAVMTLLAACQKEPDMIDKQAANACKPMKEYSYGISGALIDSASYEYTNEKLTKAHLGGEEYISYEYDGNNVKKRSVFEAGQTAPYAYQLLSYNQDGTLAKIVSYFDGGAGWLKMDSTLFNYSNSKLSSLKIYSLPVMTSSQTLTLEEEDQFIYTGNNITKLIEKSYIDGNLEGEDAFLFTYDTKPNYLKKQSSRFLQTDPFWMDFNPSYSLFAVSENNVIKVQDEATPQDSATYSYAEDAQGNVTELKVNGTSFLRYVYQCK